MQAATAERRKFVVLTGDRRIDAALPFDDTLGEAMRGLNIVLEPARHVVVERGGIEVQLSTLGEDLSDGGVYSVIDLFHVGAAESLVRAERGNTRDDKGAVWWMLGAVAAAFSGIVLLDNGGASEFAGVAQRVIAATVLGGGAAASAVVWAMRRPRDASVEAVRMIAPLVMAFAAGVAIFPTHVESGKHLGVVIGLICAGVLATLLTAAVSEPRLRSAASTAALVLLVLSAIWGATLMLGWDATAAAAISAGIVAPGLRILPTTLLNVEAGYHIEYKHFMSSRWTVRGAIPESPGQIAVADIREIVDASWTRLLVGAVLLSGTAAVFAPLALSRLAIDDPFVFGGSVGLASALIIALVLTPRHYTNPVLRWTPRAAAAVLIVAVTVAFSTTLDGPALVIVAGALLAVGVAAAIIVIPIGRGAQSLVWSRLADVIEWIAVAAAFPAALLAADILTALRGMMAS
ncbi:hypothetical protein [Salinibacterium sp. PAMC 21357]|uniref:hypothetical protein n=1 Tax=Salinibacterium sp. PAMC 21357 TaxID=1112215 RepID=UPI000287D6BA|nr:hypothetical protein [Salinibacterium sp. PAMC 21357]